MSADRIVGVLLPFRRDRKRDFAMGDGAELVVSKVRQVLGTEGAGLRSSGELPWRTSFGSSLHLLRHQNNDVVLAELGRVNIRDALRRWLPDVQVVDVTVEAAGTALKLQVKVATRAGTTVVIPVDLSTGRGGGD
jgi:phage baseplate assembly protein W